MTERVFLRVPVFTKAMRRLPRHRQEQPVLICTRQIVELPAIAPSDLSSLLPPISASQRLRDFGIYETRLMRRVRKNTGEVFAVDDLLECENLPLEDLVRTISSEADHPYAPLLVGEGELPSIIMEESAGALGPAEGITWLTRPLSVQRQIFVPSAPPTLAVSFDRDLSQILVTLAHPPAPSLSMRLPTLHMPLATDKAVLETIAGKLRAELKLGVPLVQVTEPSMTDQWIVITLAHLSRYVLRKGRRKWPDDLSFDLLERANTQVGRAEFAPAPTEWLGQFLDSRSEDYGQLGDYVDGLQRLIFARYEALGEELPPMPTDVLIDFNL